MGVVKGHYCYLPELFHLKGMTLDTPQLSWPRCSTPLCQEVFAYYLRSHPDNSFASYVTRGLQEVFRIGYSRQGGRLGSVSRNHPSSLANRAVINAHITTELQAGQLVGPLTPIAQSQVHVSPIGLVPKGHTAGKWRMIVDLSYPHSCSVNNGMFKDLCSLRYALLDDALRLIRQLDPGTQLVKMDLKDAYCLVLVHPDD